MNTARTSTARASGLMAFGTLLSRLTGAVRSLALAAFSLGALADVYQGANTTPNMIFELVAGGVLSATLVPLFAQMIRRDTQRARDGVHAIVSLFGVVVLVASVLVGVGAPWIMMIFMGGAKQAAKRAVAVQLLRLFAPQVAIYGFVTISTALLNVHRRFLAPMLAPVLNNLVVIGVLVRVKILLRANGGEPKFDLARIAHDTPTRLLLGIGTTVGVLSMAVAMVPSMRRAGISLRWHWEPRHPAIKEMARLSMWTLGYVACNLSALALVTRIANNGRDGNAAAYSLTYQTYFLLPHGLFAVSIATALQPRLAVAFADRKRGQFRKVLTRGITTQLTIMVPAAVGAFVLAKPIMTLLKTGQARDVDLFASLLQSFVVGLPAYSVFLLLMNACKAMRDTRTTFVVNGIETIFNVALAVSFTALGLGVQGLALAFGVAYLGGVVVAFRAVSKRTKGLNGHVILDALERITAAAAAMGLACWGAQHFIRRFTPNVVGARLGALLEVGVAGLVGVTVYVIAGRVLGVPDVSTLVNKIVRRTQ